MKKYTIAECREKELTRLVEISGTNDFEKARYLMNSFYRLCGLCERNLYLANNEYTCNRKSTKDSEEKEYKWYLRLKKEFETFSGLTLVYCGYMPSIGINHENGGFYEKVYRYFYN